MKKKKTKAKAGKLEVEFEVFYDGATIKYIRVNGIKVQQA